MRDTGNDERGDQVLDALLTAAAPARRTRDADTAIAIDAMVDAARFEAPPRRGRRWMIGGATAALLLAGAGTAAATGVLTPRIVPEPTGVLQYVMPDGEQCTETIDGPIRGSSRELSHAVAALLSDQEFIDEAIAGADDELQSLREGSDWGRPSAVVDGEVQYGTEYFLDPDMEWSSAVGNALHAAVRDELLVQGFALEEITYDYGSSSRSSACFGGQP